MTARRFACGVEALDRYFREQVGQDIKRRATACYVAFDLATGKLAGYYTLSAAGVPLGELPESVVKKLPRYPSVPVARLGRLAVDMAYRGKGLGGALVWDAVSGSIRSGSRLPPWSSMPRMRRRKPSTAIWASYHWMGRAGGSCWCCQSRADSHTNTRGSTSCGEGHNDDIARKG